MKLEGSVNGSQFEKISNVPFENRAGLQNISYNSNPTQQTYFRIAMTDINNKVTYSPIVHLSLVASSPNKISASPNPFSDMVNLRVQSDKNEKAVVSFYATNGALAFTQSIDLFSGNNDIRLQTSQLQKGLYYRFHQKPIQSTSTNYPINERVRLLKSLLTRHSAPV